MRRWYRNGKWALALPSVLLTQVGLADGLLESPEYNITPDAVVDQVNPAVAMDAEHGGYIAWIDNANPGQIPTVNARFLSYPIAAPYGAFAVSSGDDAAADVAIASLPNGGAVFVWEQGTDASSRIMARIVGSDGAFATDPIAIDSNYPAKRYRPSVAVDSAGNIFCSWTSFGQDGDRRGVFGRFLDSSGASLSMEFVLNSHKQLNQRDVSVAATGEGEFYAVWVDEAPAASPKPGVSGVQAYDVQIVGRKIELANWNTLVAETKLTEADVYAGAPTLAYLGGASASVAYCARVSGATNADGSEASWELFQREINIANSQSNAPVQVNSEPKGKASPASLAPLGAQILSVWSESQPLGGDVIRRFGANGVPTIVNSTERGIQFQSAVDAIDDNAAIVVWSGFNSLAAGFDTFAKILTVETVRPAPTQVFAFAKNSAEIEVTWPDLLDTDVTGYLLKINGGAAIEVASNFYVDSGLAPATQKEYQLAARYSDGSQSPYSAPVVASSWGLDGNFDGIPDDWQERYFAGRPNADRAPGADSDLDGSSNRHEFLAGTDPTDGSDTLTMSISVDGGVTRLSWNTVPGRIYQAQISQDLYNWTSHGELRFAVGETDTLLLDANTLGAYFRIVMLR